MVDMSRQLDSQNSKILFLALRVLTLWCVHSVSLINADASSTFEQEANDKFQPNGFTCQEKIYLWRIFPAAKCTSLPILHYRAREWLFRKYFCLLGATSNQEKFQCNQLPYLLAYWNLTFSPLINVCTMWEFSWIASKKKKNHFSEGKTKKKRFLQTKPKIKQ